MNSELLQLIDGTPQVELGTLLKRLDNRNSTGKFGLSDIRGVSNTKRFSDTRANLENRSLDKFLVVEDVRFFVSRR